MRVQHARRDESPSVSYTVTVAVSTPPPYSSHGHLKDKSPLPLFVETMADISTLSDPPPPTCWKCGHVVQASDPSTEILAPFQQNRKSPPTSGVWYHSKCLPDNTSASFALLPPVSPSSVPLPDSPPPSRPPSPILYPIEHGFNPFWYSNHA